MKIYIVTDGDYSDYHIEACFSSEKKAKEFMEKNGYSNYEEYELDPEIVINKNPLWRVDMNKNGEVKYCYIKIDSNIPTIDKPLTIISVWRYTNSFIHECYARDEKHAIKITNEKRIQLIACGEWEKKEKEWQENNPKEG